MRFAGVAIVLFLIGSGCGYVGPVLPPSPQIPAAITNLAAVERGGEISITFSTPARTTDGVAITEFSNLVVRVEPEASGGPAAKEYRLDTPPANDREDPLAVPVTYKIPVAEWSGQRVGITARAAIRKNGHYSAWSNKAEVEVIAPLEKPVVTVDGSASGIVLQWIAAEGVEYRVERQGPDDKQAVEVGTAKAGEYVDGSAAYDVKYTFVVTAKKVDAESLPSDPVSFLAVDRYAPAVPTGLTVLAGQDAVNLGWQRNTEPDLRGYNLYRSTNGGPYVRISEGLTLPTYSDQKAEHGKAYSYRLSATDKKGNESAPCNAVETQY